MFIPIFPNTDPDAERPSVYPIKPTAGPPSVYPTGPTAAPFPRGDCSHWTDSEVWVAFMRVPEGLDNGSAYQLLCEGMSLLRETSSKDHARIRGAKAQKAVQCSSHPPLADGLPSQVPETRRSQDRAGAICANPPPTERADGSRGSSLPDTSASEFDPFSDTFIPLAQVSLDIGWIEQADALPDVYTFFQEREQLKRCACVVVMAILILLLKDH